MENISLKTYITAVLIIAAIVYVKWYFGFDMLMMFIVIASLFIYFLPTALAWEKRKENVNAIATLNLFLGWTLLGWVVALVWAMTKNPQTSDSIQETSERRDYANELQKLADLKEKGVITQEEFDAKKKKILDL